MVQGNQKNGLLQIYILMLYVMETGVCKYERETNPTWLNKLVYIFKLNLDAAEYMLPTAEEHTGSGFFVMLAYITLSITNTIDSIE